LAGLPGIGTSLLSERLRTLENDGILRRAVAERPARAVVYELTDRGQELATAIAPLTRWGAADLDARSEDHFHPDWMAFTIRSMFNRDAARGVHDCYEFRFEDFTLWISIDDSEITITEEAPRKPDFVLITDVPTLAALGSGQLSPEAAAADGRARYEGDAEAGWRALRLLGASTTAEPLTTARPRGHRVPTKKKATARAKARPKAGGTSKSS
jgi:putative sterol carrier protein